MSDATTATISVIVPAHAAGPTLDRSLASLARLAPPPGEVLVVDDSEDGVCAAHARELGFRTLATPGRRGPAFARNRGAAAAKGDILLFFDSDVAVPPNAAGYVAARFAREPELAALIGSYDESPADTGFLSRYKNLVHRYIHQTSSEDAATFWGACGAVRRSAFDAVGGFDERYVRPSVEDIALGYRLTDTGYRIRLDRAFQITHLKRWTVRSLVASDVRDRAVPWTRLIVERGRLPNDLNLRVSSRIASVVVWLTLAATIAAVLRPGLWPLPVLLLGILVALDAPLWRYLAARGGVIFLLESMAWHWFYYLYSSLAFGVAYLGVARR